jgi:hypothetical protein
MVPEVGLEGAARFNKIALKLLQQKGNLFERHAKRLLKLFT